MKAWPPDDRTDLKLYEIVLFEKLISIMAEKPRPTQIGMVPRTLRTSAIRTNSNHQYAANN
jgi:hypothetical protein